MLKQLAASPLTNHSRCGQQFVKVTGGKERGGGGGTVQWMKDNFVLGQI